MSNLSHKSVIIVSRLYFIYFEQGKKSIQFNFSDAAVSDMEIVNKAEFDKLITQFIIDNKLIPTTCLIIVSQDLTFEKELTSQTIDELNTATSNFQENVPFDDVVSNTVKKDKNYQIIAYNGDFIRTIKSIFEKQGFLIEQIIPEQIVLKNINIKSIGDTLGLKMVIDHFDSAKQIHEININSKQKNSDEEEKEEIQPQSQSKPIPRIYLMLGALILLFIVLLILLFSQFAPKKRVVIMPKNNLKKPSPSPAYAIEPTPLSTSAVTLEESKLKIQILNATTTPGLADSFRKTLNDFGFTQIEVGSANTPSTSDTLVVFSTNVPVTTRQKITKLIEDRFNRFTTQENNTLKFDAIITLSKPQITP